MTKVLIIEDEQKAARELKVMLDRIRQDVEIVNIIGSVEASINWLQKYDPPDLIFSDIQLSDGTSFDIYAKVKVSSPIIFCTAFDEYMLKAFEANGIAFLLKPIKESKVAESLRKYDDLKSVFSKDYYQAYHRQIEVLLSQFRSSYVKTLLVNARDKIFPLKVEEVAYFYYNEGVVVVCLFNNKQYFIQETMEDLELKLNPTQFYRANRQYIINRNSIVEIERYFSRKLIVHLFIKNPYQVVISKLKASHFLNWLESNQ